MALNVTGHNLARRPPRLAAVVKRLRYRPSLRADGARRAGGVKRGKAAERSEGTLDAVEHRALIKSDGR
jgi:hypothetical protein